MDTQTRRHKSDNRGRVTERPRCIEPAATPDGQLMNTRDAAAYLDMSEAWLREGRRPNPRVGRTPPFSRFGRAIKYRRSDLDAFIEQNLKRHH